MSSSYNLPRQPQDWSTTVPGVFEIADQYIEGWAALDPYDATLEGIGGYDDEATDYSPAGAEARADLNRRTLRQLDSAEVHDDRERLAADFLRERIEALLALHDAGEHLMDLNVLRPPSGYIRQVFDVMPRESDEDWRAISARLQAVPGALAGYRETLDEGIRQGKTVLRRIVLAVSEQAKVWSGNGDPSQSFFRRLVQPYVDSSADTALKADLGRGADAAATAYADFARYLTDRYAPAATEREGAGEDRYQLHSRQYNGSRLDLLDTYNWGWDEVHRIEQEMRKTAERIKPGSTPQEAVAFLNTDPGRAVEGADAYRDWLQQVHDQALKDMDGVHFDIPPQIKTIEVRIPPPGGALAPYYTAPSEGFTWPGRTWWPTGSASRFPKWDRVSIAYHEGVPGHHLQVGAVRCMTDSLSRHQQITFVAGHGEGWALYAERLMNELGYFENPDYYMGLLASQQLRAVRVVIDIGLHLGLPIPASERFHPGENWNYDLAVQFATERANQTEEFMKSEVLRYLGWPSQAISYKVGERAWLAAREAAKARLGASFDLKRFHSVALALGPIGLEGLEREIMKALGVQVN
jgi:uncharacterized protein (DUF885 family)